MPHPTPDTDAWHATEAADEPAWLDQWARLHLIPVPEQHQPAPAVPVLTTTGSH
ncbi:hypothetical protein [Streptomyces mexicanus]|uniref:hypothetical protein n=1 Tax=Streptomyces mexicanus TaxID=178566 RepID=UPI00365CA7BD